MAGFIPEQLIKEVIQRASIVEVIGEYVGLKRVGRGYQGLCPFHQDSKPSFHVNEERGFFHCFGCGAGGNVFHFLMRHLHMSFPEAVRSVASRYGVDIPEQRLAKGPRMEQREALLELHNEALRFFRAELDSAGGAKAREYLSKRGFSREILDAFQVGYAPKQWRSLARHLRRKGLPLERAQEAGLVISAKDGGYYDRFRGRVIFPIQDEAGRVIAFGGRSLDNEHPKYLNSPESPIFSKRRSLYGLFMAKGPVRDQDKVIVVEGYTDVMALHQHGIKNAVATLGTAITTDHLHVLRRYCSHVVHVFDADEAGKRATMRATDLCLDAGIWGAVLGLPPGEDPDTFVRKMGGEGFKEALSRSLPLLDFLIQTVLEEEDTSSLEGRLKALGQILPRLRKIRDPIIQDHYVDLLSRVLGIREQRIRELLNRGERPAIQFIQRGSISAKDRTERLLIQGILKDPSLSRCLESGIIKYFENEKLREIAKLIDRWRQTEEEDLLSYLHTATEDPDVAAFLARLVDDLEEVEDPERVCEDCLRHLRRRDLEGRIRALNGEIAQARKKGDPEAAKALERKRAALITEKAKLKMMSIY